MKQVEVRHADGAIALSVPDDTAVLRGQGAAPVPDPTAALRQGLDKPIGTPAFEELLRERRPGTVAITISDITRPVPNRVLLRPLLEGIHRCGIPDDRVVILIGTGLHRTSTPEEREQLVGRDLLDRYEVVDHDARDASTLTRVSEDPPVHVCRRFAESDFRIVTGYIKGHFVAGFSGGRKGVCPALVDLRTVQRFHGAEPLDHPKATFGVLDGNPCHEIALAVARRVGVDFLLNVTLTHEREISGVYAGELEAAHLAGCRDAARAAAAASVDHPFDLVVTGSGGAPLDRTFYQSIKGMYGALPALGPESTLLLVTDCVEGVGSDAYRDILFRYDNDWQRFLRDIRTPGRETELDQWEYQKQAQVLARIGMDRLWLAADGLPMDVQDRLSVTPVRGTGDVGRRAQRAVDRFLADHPNARLAVIPDGPYTMLEGGAGTAVS